jgi:hypothetical protein
MPRPGLQMEHERSKDRGLRRRDGSSQVTHGIHDLQVMQLRRLCYSIMLSGRCSFSTSLLSRRQLEQVITEFAAGLRSLGLSKGDKVADSLSDSAALVHLVLQVQQHRTGPGC